MADFDKKEWMDEQKLRPGEWQSMKVMPVSVYCDIRLKTGKEIGPCWPLNNGVFVDLSDDEKEIKTSDVIAIRFYMDVDPDEEDEDEEEGDDDDEETPSRQRHRYHVDSVED